MLAKLTRSSSALSFIATWNVINHSAHLSFLLSPANHSGLASPLTQPPALVFLPKRNTRSSQAPPVVNTSTHILSLFTELFHLLSAHLGHYFPSKSSKRRYLFLLHSAYFKFRRWGLVSFPPLPFKDQMLLLWGSCHCIFSLRICLRASYKPGTVLGTQVNQLKTPSWLGIFLVILCNAVSEWVSEWSHSVVSDSLRPHGL